MANIAVIYKVYLVIKIFETGIKDGNNEVKKNHIHEQ